jgi:hypothetical protein
MIKNCDDFLRRRRRSHQPLSKNVRIVNSKNTFLNFVLLWEYFAILAQSIRDLKS